MTEAGLAHRRQILEGAVLEFFLEYDDETKSHTGKAALHHPPLTVLYGSLSDDWGLPGVSTATLAVIVNGLCDRGLLKRNPRGWTLTPEGVTEAFDFMNRAGGGGSGVSRP